jgi:hypothetical protein
MAAIYLDENSGLLMYKKDGKMTPVSTNAVFFPEDCVKFYTSGPRKHHLLLKDMTGTFLPVVDTDGKPVEFATNEDVSVKQSREDPRLKTSDKTIVGAINELATKSGAAVFSHTYPVGKELITVYDTLTTLPAGTYTITADIVVDPDPTTNFQSACLVIGAIEKPCVDVVSKVKDFGEEFTITKDT